MKLELTKKETELIASSLYFLVQNHIYKDDIAITALDLSEKLIKKIEEK